MIFQTLKTSAQDIMEHFQLVGVPFGHGLNTTNEQVVWWPDYRGMYLTFVARESNVTFQFSGSSASNTLQYRKNGDQEWTTLAAGASTPAIQPGESIMWKASGLTIDSSSGIGQFISTGQFKADGNTMSLIFGDDFYGQTSLNGKASAFTYLFSACTGLTTAENLILPATTLADRCYRGMFQGCTSLTTAPELPSTALINYCYYGMFSGCTSLTTAPELPATTLASNCYLYMFYGCTSLITAPELPATTLAGYCYQSMFEGCTSLTTAPELPATTLVERCYQSMFEGCTSLNYVKCLAASGMTSSYCLSNWLDGVASTGTFVKSPNATTGSTAGASQWRINSVNGIPSGWTVQDA